MSDFTDLRESMNETARVARAHLLFLLLVGLFLGILVFNTGDLVLLKAGNIALPLMELGVPVTWFYVVVPPLYLLLHINLFVRLFRLVEVVGFARNRLGDAWKDRQEILYATTYPFDFLQLILHKKFRIRLAVLFLLVFFTVYLIPLILLIWMQLRFLPYQSLYVILVHQIVTTLFCVSAIALAIHGTIVLRKTHKTTSRIFCILAPWTAPTLSVLLFGTLAIWFVWTVAIPPEIPSACQVKRDKRSTMRACIFDDWWLSEKCSLTSNERGGPFRRHLKVIGEFISIRPSLDAITLSYASDQSYGEREKTLAGTLQLPNRHFLYADFSYSQFDRVSFRFSKFHCAKMIGSVMEGANLTGANLFGTRLSGARLNGAYLRGANLSVANLERAELNGADLSELFPGRMEVLDKTNLDGAKLTRTQLNGANLRKATMRGAYLYKTEINGANLDGLILQGASFGDVQTAGVRNVNLSFDLIFVGGSLNGSIDKAKEGVAYWKYRKTRQAIKDELERLDERTAAKVVFGDATNDQRCVWPRDVHSYNVSSLPSESCKRNLVETACRSRHASVSERISSNLAQWKKGRWVELYLNVLDEPRSSCPGTSSSLRKVMCGRLSRWAKAQERQGEMGSVSVVNQDVRLRERWNKLSKEVTLQKTCFLRHCSYHTWRPCI